ncbi:MAG: hypothetical protein M3Q46_04585 [Verrucomicrobiota bacterium]|nr:hypothetical protein [Verrucomicrobiota bacterium]
MTTRSRCFHLRGLFLLSAALACGSMLSAAAVAGPMNNRESTPRPHVALEMSAQKTIKIYVLTSASAIPSPIAYVIGGVMTTSTPVQIIGRGRTVSR